MPWRPGLASVEGPSGRLLNRLPPKCKPRRRMLARLIDEHGAQELSYC